MQSKKKGFTLIELLAVIVILAIIALIAVPVIMNVIGNARKSAFEDSVYGIVKAGEIYYSNKLLDAEGMTSDKEFTITNGAFVGEALEVSGSLPSNGKVTVTKEGKLAIALSNGEYCVRKATTESEIKSEKLSDLNGVCDYKKAANPVFTKATGATSVPACITNNTACNVAAAGNDGIKVGVKVSDTADPLDFYVMSEDTDKGTITLIMNQNLEENVAWVSEDDYISAGGTEADYGSNGNNNKGPITVLKALEERTSGWTNIPSETYTLTSQGYPTMTRTARARLITSTEAAGLGCTDNLGTCPTWLHENLNYPSGLLGYWSISARADNSSNAWYVYYYGAFFNSSVNDDSRYGVRPVITISKSAL